MVAKALLVGLLALSCVFFARAEITNDDIAALKSGWKKYTANPVELTAGLIDRLVDGVAIPVAKDALDLLDVVLDKQSRLKILALLPLLKNASKKPEFKTTVETAVDVINKSVLPNLQYLSDIFNEKEEFIKKRVNQFINTALKFYHLILDKTEPVISNYRPNEFDNEEKAVVTKIFRELSMLDLPMIKRILQGF